MKVPKLHLDKLLTNSVEQPGPFTGPSTRFASSVRNRNPYGAGQFSERSNESIYHLKKMFLGGDKIKLKKIDRPIFTGSQDQ